MLACQGQAREVGKREDVRSKISTKARERFQDEMFAQASINTPEYKELQSSLSSGRWASDDYKCKVSESLKRTLSDSNKRARMSEASKASTAKRLESRARNKLAREAAIAESVI